MISDLLVVPVLALVAAGAPAVGTEEKLRPANVVDQEARGIEWSVRQLLARQPERPKLEAGLRRLGAKIRSLEPAMAAAGTIAVITFYEVGGFGGCPGPV